MRWPFRNWAARCLTLQKFEAANDYLKKALAAGAGPEARLLYVEALAGRRPLDEASAEMNRYLDGRDVKKMPLRVRQMWASIQNRQKVEDRLRQGETAERPCIASTSCSILPRT